MLKTFNFLVKQRDTKGPRYERPGSKYQFADTSVMASVMTFFCDQSSKTTSSRDLRPT